MASAYTSLPASPPQSPQRPSAGPRRASGSLEDPRHSVGDSVNPSSPETPSPSRRNRRGHSEGDILGAAMSRGQRRRSNPVAVSPQVDQDSEGPQTLQEFLQSLDQAVQPGRPSDTQRTSSGRERRQRRFHALSETSGRRASYSPHHSYTQSPHEQGTPRSHRANTLQPARSQPQMFHALHHHHQQQQSQQQQWQQQEGEHVPHPGRRVSTSSLGPGTYLKPRWQPDTEVSVCPICRKLFSFFFRKHHCRKCGRVVCANCSPHRITIPKQFIVEPPEANEAAEQVEVLNEAGEEGEAEESAIFGGQEVRLCNPCVPDPNPLPPPDYGGTARDVLTTFPPHGYDGQVSSSPQPFSPPSHAYGNTAQVRFPQRTSSNRDWVGAYDANSRPDTLARQRSSTDPHARLGPRSPTGLRNPNRPAAGAEALTPGIESASLAPPPTVSQRSERRHRAHASTSILPHQRVPPPPPDLNAPLPPRPGPPPPPPPPLRIREEDECPICHGELPPKGLDGDEREREAHVASCIDEHLSPGARAVPASSSAASRGQAAAGFSGSGDGEAGVGASSAPSGPSSMPAAATASSSSMAATAAVAASAGGGGRARAETQVGGSGAGSLAGTRYANWRRANMLVYHASEKDCVDAEGRVKECVICLEDFVVGDELGRLECWCAFHRRCIRNWWDTKGVGACPTHQDGI